MADQVGSSMGIAGFSSSSGFGADGRTVPGIAALQHQERLSVLKRTSPMRHSPSRPRCSPAASKRLSKQQEQILKGKRILDKFRRKRNKSSTTMSFDSSAVTSANTSAGDDAEDKENHVNNSGSSILNRAKEDMLSASTRTPFSPVNSASNNTNSNSIISSNNKASPAGGAGASTTFGGGFPTPGKLNASSNSTPGKSQIGLGAYILASSPSPGGHLVASPLLLQASVAASLSSADGNVVEDGDEEEEEDDDLEGVGGEEHDVTMGSDDDEVKDGDECTPIRRVLDESLRHCAPNSRSGSVNNGPGSAAKSASKLGCTENESRSFSFAGTLATVSDLSTAASAPTAGGGGSINIGGEELEGLRAELRAAKEREHELMGEVMNYRDEQERGRTELARAEARAEALESRLGEALLEQEPNLGTRGEEEEALLARALEAEGALEEALQRAGGGNSVGELDGLRAEMQEAAKALETLQDELEEAQRSAEEAHQKAEEARKSAEEAQKRADEAEMEQGEMRVELERRAAQAEGAQFAVECAERRAFEAEDAQSRLRQSVEDAERRAGQAEEAFACLRAEGTVEEREGREVKEELAALEALVEDAERRASQMEIEQAHFRDALEEAERRTSEAESEQARLRQDVEDAERRASQMGMEQAHSRQTAIEAESEQARLREAAEDAERRAIEAESEQARLREATEDAERRAFEFEGRVSELLGSLAKAEKELSVSYRSFGESGRNQGDVEAELAAVKKTLVETEARLSESKRAVRDAEEAKSAAEMDKEALAREMESKVARLKETQVEATALKTQFTSPFRRLRVKASVQEDVTRRLEEQLKGARLQVESLEGELSKEKEEAWVRGVAADQEAERLSALLEESRRAGARAEDEVIELRARCAKLEGELLSEREEGEAVAGRVREEANRAREEADIEVGRLRGEVGALRERVSELEEEAGRVRERMAEELEKAEEGAKERERDIVGEVERLRRRAEVLMSANDELLAENGMLMKEGTELRAALEKEREERAALEEDDEANSLRASGLSCVEEGAEDDDAFGEEEEQGKVEEDEVGVGKEKGKEGEKGEEEDETEEEGVAAVHESFDMAKTVASHTSSPPSTLSPPAQTSSSSSSSTSGVDAWTQPMSPQAVSPAKHAAGGVCAPVTTAPVGAPVGAPVSGVPAERSNVSRQNAILRRMVEDMIGHNADCEARCVALQASLSETEAKYCQLAKDFSAAESRAAASKGGVEDAEMKVQEMRTVLGEMASERGALSREAGKLRMRVRELEGQVALLCQRGGMLGEGGVGGRASSDVLEKEVSGLKLKLEDAEGEIQGLKSRVLVAERERRAEAEAREGVEKERDGLKSRVEAMGAAEAEREKDIRMEMAREREARAFEKAREEERGGEGGGVDTEAGLRERIDELMRDRERLLEAGVAGRAEADDREELAASLTEQVDLSERLLEELASARAQIEALRSGSGQAAYIQGHSSGRAPSNNVNGVRRNGESNVGAGDDDDAGCMGGGDGDCDDARPSVLDGESLLKFKRMADQRRREGGGDGSVAAHDADQMAHQQHQHGQQRQRLSQANLAASAEIFTSQSGIRHCSINQQRPLTRGVLPSGPGAYRSHTRPEWNSSTAVDRPEQPQDMQDPCEGVSEKVMGAVRRARARLAQRAQARIRLGGGGGAGAECMPRSKQQQQPPQQRAVHSSRQGLWSANKQQHHKEWTGNSLVSRAYLQVDLPQSAPGAAAASLRGSCNASAAMRPSDGYASSDAGVAWWLDVGGVGGCEPDVSARAGLHRQRGEDDRRDASSWRDLSMVANGSAGSRSDIFDEGGHHEGVHGLRATQSYYSNLLPSPPSPN